MRQPITRNPGIVDRERRGSTILKHHLPPAEPGQLGDRAATEPVDTPLESTRPCMPRPLKTYRRRAWILSP
jgi:hypothetical protein